MALANDKGGAGPRRIAHVANAEHGTGVCFRIMQATGMGSITAAATAGHYVSNASTD